MATRWIASEASSLNKRLSELPLFSETIPMVSDAAPSGHAMAAADRSIRRAKSALGRKVGKFQRSLLDAPVSPKSLGGVHRRLTALRDQYDALLSSYDIYADAVTQRSEHGVGAILKGLDALALDSLRTEPSLFDPPPLVCFFDAGLGGAIRRVFTRLPHGEMNGIALIKLPRERLFSSALASLLHEAGHQGVAHLDLVPSYSQALRKAAEEGELEQEAASWWAAKLSEVLPDAWALCKLGAAATQGLLLAMGRGKRFTFHENPMDPHPMPYLRGLLSAWLGEAALPHPVWQDLRTVWDVLYGAGQAQEEAARWIGLVKPSLPKVAALLAGHRPPGLRGKTLPEALDAGSVHPAHLMETMARRLDAIRRDASQDSPCQAFAAVGLARFLGLIDAAEEHALLKKSIRMAGSGHQSEQ